MKQLQSVSSSPLYYQLMQRIREDIDRGTYLVGTRIPAEHDLEQLYQVSRVTVRRALAELTSEGLLERKQGKGTFVALKRGAQNLKNVHSFHETCLMNGKTPSVRVLGVRELPAGPRDLEELHLQHGDRMIETSRLLLADGEPVVLEENHFSMAYAYLEESNLSGSLYQVLREYGIEPRQGEHEISLEQAGPRQAEALGVAGGTALLCLREVIFDQRGRPLHNSVQWIRGDRFVFRI